MNIEISDAIAFQEYHRQFFIYFLLRDEQVVYVGKTNDLHGRIKCHKKTQMNFNRVLCGVYPENDVERMENSFIEKYQPEYNIRGTRKPLHTFDPTRRNHQKKRLKLALSVVRDYVEQKGHTPTVREIARIMDIRSSNGAQSHLNNLRKNGYLDGHARNMKITTKGHQWLNSK